VTTQGDVRASEATNKMMLNNLYKYISGANSDKKKMDLTEPIVMSYVCKNNRTINKNSEVTASMSFYIPSKFVNNTPKPRANNVVIRELPEFVVAVVRFAGFANLYEYMKTRDDLVKTLGSDAKSYDTINIVTAEFIYSRKYEVWIPKMK
jgi:hypothetical protein